MEKEVIRGDNHITRIVEELGAPISSVIKAGDFVFVSGTPPIDKEGNFVAGDIREQTALVLENLKLLLESAGSSLDKVVKCTLFCTNSAYWNSVNEIYATYFPSDPPTRTFVPWARGRRNSTSRSSASPSPNPGRQMGARDAARPR